MLYEGIPACSFDVVRNTDIAYGCTSCAGNVHYSWIGLASGILGFSVYSTILTGLNLWLVLFLLAGTAVSYFLYRRISKSVEYTFEFRNVSFRYPDSEEFALRNVSCILKSGERLAVVGQNGSGKSNFIKQLCRLYDPAEGEILLNETDIREYNYDEYLSAFSVVFQEFRLFAFSLGQNVAAAVNYDRKSAAECLKAAGFDEPTAALDPIAECEIYTRFNEIIGDRTALYISHRLASYRF